MDGYWGSWEIEALIDLGGKEQGRDPQVGKGREGAVNAFVGARFQDRDGWEKGEV